MKNIKKVLAAVLMIAVMFSITGCNSSDYKKAAQLMADGMVDGHVSNRDRQQVLEHYLAHAREAGFGVLGLTYSPIRGPEGNIEYLGFLQKGAETTVSFDLDALVEESHQTLKEHGEGTV